MEDIDATSRNDDGEDDEEGVTDNLHLRLMLGDDQARSSLMWQQVTAFQEKVILCLDTFDPEVFLSHVRVLSSLPQQHSVLASSIHSLGRLRLVVQQQLRRASLRTDGTVYFTARQSQAALAARCTQYFVWLFDFMDYLAQLQSHFTQRIFLPLFQYFHQIAFLSGQGRSPTTGSTLSKISISSSDSGRHAPYSANNPDPHDKTSTDTARRRSQSTSALQELSHQFADIKTLYDTKELDLVAQRLTFLKEQVDHILEEEDELDPAIFSVDSGHLVSHLHMDEGTENLVRLPLDILVKLRKMVWLCRKWLTHYDKQSLHLQHKLITVQALEGRMKGRLRQLEDDIMQQETQLGRQTEELHVLMEREGRCHGLGITLYNLDLRLARLLQHIAQLKVKRDSIAKRVTEVVSKVEEDARGGRRQEYQHLKVELQQNKLRRYVVEREIAALRYQQQLLAEDRQVELQVRPSLIRHTNHVQDTCERLEHTIREKKKERDYIRSALVPVSEDRSSLAQKLAHPSSSDISTAAQPLTAGGWIEATIASSQQARFVQTYKTGQWLTSSDGLMKRSGSTLQGITVPGWLTPPQW